jgi:hypothetical protein
VADTDDLSDVPRVVAVTKIVFIGSLACEELRVKLSLPREVTTGPGEFRERGRADPSAFISQVFGGFCEAGASAPVKPRVIRIRPLERLSTAIQ